MAHGRCGSDLVDASMLGFKWAWPNGTLDTETTLHRAP